MSIWKGLLTSPGFLVLVTTAIELLVDVVSKTKKKPPKKK